MKTVTCSPFTIFHLRSAFILLALALGTLAVVHRVEAVNPPPDGGYPGGNAAEGQSALLSLTTGGFNTAVGFSSLRSDTDGAFNTAIGAGTLFANTASQNTATGAGALLSNTTGVQNTAMERSPSLAIQKAAITRPTVGLRFKATAPALTTPQMVLARSLTTLLAVLTRPMARSRSKTTLQEATTRP